MSALPGGKGSLQGHPLLLKLQKWKKICFILASVGFKVYISYSPLLSSSAPSVLPFKNLSQESLPSLAPYRKLLSAVIPLGPSQLEGGVPQGMLDNNNKDARLQDSKECPGSGNEEVSHCFNLGSAPISPQMLAASPGISCSPLF